MFSTRVLASLTWWKDPSRGTLSALTIHKLADDSHTSLRMRIDNLLVQGEQEPQEMALHINVHEVKAIRQAYKEFLPSIQNRHLQVTMDNTMFIYYRKQQRGIKFSLLNEEAAQLW